MPPARALQAGAIFARTDVTQRQFEAKTKACFHSEQERRISDPFEMHCAMKIRPEMFHFAQHQSSDSFLL